MNIGSRLQSFRAWARQACQVPNPVGAARAPATISLFGRRVSLFPLDVGIMAEHNPFPFSSADNEKTVLQIILARRARARVFGTELFSDPGWDVLLALFLARLRHQRMTLVQLGRDVTLSPKLAGRWIDTLDQHGLVRRRSDPGDRRRTFVELSEKGTEAMREWLDASRDIEKDSGDRVIDLLSRIRNDRG